MPVKEENWIPLAYQESPLMLAIHMPFTIFTLFLGVSVVIYNISVLLTILARKNITVIEKKKTRQLSSLALLLEFCYKAVCPSEYVGSHSTGQRDRHVQGN